MSNMIKEKVVELVIGREGVPVWDIQLETYRGGPAPVRQVFFRVEQNAIQPKMMKLVTCVVFAITPGADKMTRRLGLLTPDGAIGERLGKDARYLGGYMHPNEFPVSLYEFDSTLMDEEEGEAKAPPKEAVDVMAALARHQEAVARGASEDEAVTEAAHEMIARNLPKNDEVTP